MTVSTLFDTHVHISDPAFDADRAAVLARAHDRGVTRMVDVGISVETSERAVHMAETTPGVYASVGVHPYDGDLVDAETIRALARLATAEKVVALGETGLDYFRDRSSREGQARALELHLELACDTNLPVILHLRSSANAGKGAEDAYEACAAILARYQGRVRGISHCFSATPALAEVFCDLGFYVSFAGNVTYPSAEVLREAARVVPLDRILVETDAPYLAPQGHRGQRNEPGHVALTSAAIARVRGLTPDALRAAATANAERLFGLGPARADKDRGGREAVPAEAGA